MKSRKQTGDIKAAAAKQGEPLRKKIAELSARIGAFAEYNKADLFRDRKSVDLTFDVFGFRKSTSISVKKTTVVLLEKPRLDKYVKVEKQPDKEALRNWTMSLWPRPMPSGKSKTTSSASRTARRSTGIS